jgi:murein biosynthesis integral membrane protein MurJ
VRARGRRDLNINSLEGCSVDKAAHSSHQATKRASIVGMAIIGSRVFGLIREQVFAAMFGAGKLLDAFYGAFRIPNLLRDLLAEGALSTAFTTVFAQVQEKEGMEKAWRLVRLMFSLMIVVVGALMLIGIAAAPVIISLTNAGFHAVEGKLELTVSLTRVLFPFIFFVSIAAVVMGILNARHIYALPASASTVFNIVSVVCGLVLAYLFDPQENWLQPHFTEKALHGVALGVLLGGLAQLLIQLPSLCRRGVPPRLALGHQRSPPPRSASADDPKHHLWGCCAGERPRQRHLRLHDQWRHLMAQLRLSPHAISHRRLWSGYCDCNTPCR